MGWANCGTDSKGRPIGYAHEARCDEPGCRAKINRGLSYACGGMHGESTGCEGYFCGDHRTICYDPDEQRALSFCRRCAARLDDYKAEAFKDLLIHAVRTLPEDAGAQAFKDAVLKFKQEVYDLLIHWDEPEDLPVDRRFLKPKDEERLRAMAAIRAEAAQYATQHAAQARENHDHH